MPTTLKSLPIVSKPKKEDLEEYKQFAHLAGERFG